MKIGSSVKSRNALFTKLTSYPQIILILLLVSFSIGCSGEGSGKMISFRGTTMGTTYSVKLISFTDDIEETQLKSSVDSLLHLVNGQMSTYLKNSELSIFNFSFDTGWHDVSKDLAFVINEAKRIGEKSGRFYDITVGPIVNLWGFGPEGVPLAVPIESSILKAKLRTGIEKLYVDLEFSKIKKSIPDLYIDLSSIAKGFGVDRTSMLLENYGIKNYMVEIGGEVRTAGTNEKKKQWRIGISTPVDNQLQKIVSLSGVSIATSGDYLNYFEKQGIRYSHLIDPLTGRPISHNLASVSVIHKNCMIADAYATAINVMGTERGIDFAENEKLPVFMIVREGNKFIEKMTPEFKEYIDKGYNND